MLSRQLDRVRSLLSEQLSTPATRGRALRAQLAVGCAIVFAVAFTIRLLYWQDASAEIARGDSTIQSLANPYRDEVKRMRDAGGVLYPPGNIDQGDARAIGHPPGYAILMGVAMVLFGDPDTPLRLVQIILAAAQSVVIVLIAAELLPGALAIIAGSITAFSPHLAYYSIFLSPDSLAVLPILMAVYLVIRANKQPRLIPIIGAGLLVGVSCWLRPNALFLSVFLALAVLFLFQRGKRLQYAVALIVASFAVIAPLTLRNWIVYGRFIPISIGSGLNLVEGIAEYDKQGRFELPVLDPDVIAKEVEWYERPDYGQGLYFPDGIEREQARFSRGLSVIRSDPGWFTGVMLRRMVFMLRYNDFRFENPSFNTPVAPAVSASPTYGHALAVPDSMPPVWSRPMAEAIRDCTFVALGAYISVEEEDRILQITGDSSAAGDQFVTAPIAVEKGADYILALRVEGAWGASSAKVRTADPRIILAASRIKETRRKKRVVDAKDAEPGSGRLAYLHFATGNAAEVRIVIANNRVTASDRADSERPVVQLSRADLFLAGPTPHQWTRGPRAAIRGFQKTLFKTEWMWLLIIIGVGLLVLAGRGRTLLILLAVPAYYLIVHSALHTEYRYILAIHYFLFVCAAVTFYFAGTTLWSAAIRQRLTPTGEA
jgi:dolichyl-phosphate-mannose-protein mannosyltransferase